jgi:aerobic C4-dicarboxylate transport protein
MFRRLATSLYGQILIATLLGVAVGYVDHSLGTAMKPFGDGFIKLVRMIAGPIIFCTVVGGIAGMRDVKAVGRAGVLTLLYFEVVTTLALAFGLLVVNVVKPGAGMNIDPATLDPRAATQYLSGNTVHSVSDFLLSLIPSSPVDAFVRVDILQILCFSVLFGFALQALGPAGDTITAFIDRLAQVLFAIVGLVMRVAPLGAFGAMAFTVGSFGVERLKPLVVLIACFWISCALFVTLVLSVVTRLAGTSLWRVLRYIREEIFVAFGTSSSEAVLPRLMTKLEAAGVDRSIVGLVIPAGYSFNLDGTAIYLSIATMFIAQATNTPLTLAQQAVLFAILLVTSKGSAGVAGAALVVLAGTLAATNTIPVGGVVLVLGIHRFMGEGMAVSNTIGNTVATIAIGRWTGRLDALQLRRALEGTVEESSRNCAV